MERYGDVYGIIDGWRPTVNAFIVEGPGHLQRIWPLIAADGQNYLTLHCLKLWNWHQVTKVSIITNQILRQQLGVDGEEKANWGDLLHHGERHIFAKDSALQHLHLENGDWQSQGQDSYEDLIKYVIL